MKALGRVARRKRRSGLQRIAKVYGDKGYQGVSFATWVKRKLGAVVRIGNNLTQKGSHFIPDKKRWVVERAFAWIFDCYRLTVDRERLLATGLTSSEYRSFDLCCTYCILPPPNGIFAAKNLGANRLSSLF